MRLLLDEMLSGEVGARLRDRGHDVVAIQDDPARRGLADPEVLAIAIAVAERRAVVTLNVRDFRPLHQRAVMDGGDGHFGIVFVAGRDRRARGRGGSLIAALDALLAAHPAGDAFRDAEVWL